MRVSSFSSIPVTFSLRPVTSCLTVPTFLDGADVLLEAGDVFLDGADVLLEAGDVFLDGADVLLEAGDVFLDGADVLLEAGDVLLDGADVLLEAGDVLLDGADVLLEAGDVLLDGADVLLEAGDVLLDGADVLLEAGDVFLDGAGVFLEGGEVVPEEVDVLPDRADVAPHVADLLADVLEPAVHGLAERGHGGQQRRARHADFLAEAVALQVMGGLKREHVRVDAGLHGGHVDPQAGDRLTVRLGQGVDLSRTQVHGCHSRGKLLENIVFELRYTLIERGRVGHVVIVRFATSNAINFHGVSLLAMYCHFPRVNGNDLRNVGWRVSAEVLVST